MLMDEDLATLAARQREELSGRRLLPVLPASGQGASAHELGA
jgi:hypothetical protein